MDIPIRTTVGTIDCKSAAKEVRTKDQNTTPHDDHVFQQLSCSPKSNFDKIAVTAASKTGERAKR